MSAQDVSVFLLTAEEIHSASMLSHQEKTDLLEGHPLLLGLIRIELRPPGHKRRLHGRQTKHPSYDKRD